MIDSTYPLNIYVVTRGLTMSCIATQAHLDRATALRVSGEKNDLAQTREPGVVYGYHQISLFLKNVLLFEEYL